MTISCCDDERDKILYLAKTTHGFVGYMKMDIVPSPPPLPVRSLFSTVGVSTVTSLQFLSPCLLGAVEG